MPAYALYSDVVMIGKTPAPLIQQGQERKEEGLEDDLLSQAALGCG